MKTKVIGVLIAVYDTNRIPDVFVRDLLNGVTDATTATAYSVAQQLVTTDWNILFAIVLVTWAFGWTGGRKLVGDSYTDAKVKAADQKAQHKAKRQAKKAAKQAEDADGAEPSSARRLLRRVK